MSHKERNYLKVLEQLEQGQLKRREAAELMACSERQVSRLRAAYRQGGDAALIHGLRGKPSNRRRSDQQQQEIINLVALHYHDFGPTFACEKLAEHGYDVSREWLRQEMTKAGLWRPRPRKVTVRQWRERKPCFGQMVQMDTSEHDWFEGRGEHAELILMIDDATSHAYLRFVSADTSATNREVLAQWLQCHGRPLALYTDKASHFVVNRPASVQEQLRGLEQAETQIGRALRELDIELIVAHSPQAKGRAERFFGTAQDRLVKELRLAKVATIEAANRFLDEVYMPWWNTKHTVAAASPADAHRSVQGFDLGAILSRQTPRQVQNDFTIKHNKSRYQILPESQLPNLRKRLVTVQERLDGTLWVWAKGQYLQVAPVPAGGAAAAPAVGLRPPSGAAAPEAEVAKGSKVHKPKGHKPAAGHPWRNPNTRAYLFGR